MARKKYDGEVENHERWLISYADFITLLFAFFVVMYAISVVNEGKYRVFSDALGDGAVARALATELAIFWYALFFIFGFIDPRDFNPGMACNPNIIDLRPE